MGVQTQHSLTPHHESVPRISLLTLSSHLQTRWSWTSSWTPWSTPWSSPRRSWSSTSCRSWSRSSCSTWSSSCHTHCWRSCQRSSPHSSSSCSSHSSPCPQCPRQHCCEDSCSSSGQLTQHCCSPGLHQPQVLHTLHRGPGCWSRGHPQPTWSIHCLRSNKHCF